MAKLQSPRRKLLATHDDAMRGDRQVTTPARRFFSRSEKKQREKAMEKGLQAIYEDKKNAPSDLGIMVHKKSPIWLWWFVGILLLSAVATGAAWGGFFLLQPFQVVSAQGLELSIDGPTSVTLGQESTYLVHWKNIAGSAISEADVRGAFPSDFVLTGTEPEPSDQNLMKWNLGMLPLASQGTLVIKGIFTGARKTQTTVQAMASYRISSGGQDAQSSTNLPIVYADSVLKTAVTAPLKTMAGDVVNVQYDIQNTGAKTMQGMVARFILPEGFIPSGVASGTNATAYQDVRLADLAPGATSTVHLIGSFASGASGDHVMSASVGHVSGDTFIPYDQSDVTIPVVAGDLTLHVVANGSSVDRTILPGDMIRLAIDYQNTSPEQLKKIALRVTFDSIVNGTSTKHALFAWKDLTDSAHGTSSTSGGTGTIRYTSTQIAGLDALAPQDEGTIEISLPTVSAASGTQDAAVRISVAADVPWVGATNVKRTVKASPITLRYKSDVQLTSQARYFTEEGAPLGFGPLPPVATKTTAYRVFWDLSKTLHPLDHVVVQATLPKISVWSVRAMSDIGAVTYDQDTHVVSWSIDHVPDATKNAEASFEVQVTPDTLDIGRFAALLGETTWQVQDPIVTETITGVQGALSTDLENDDGAKGKGVVRKDGGP